MKEGWEYKQLSELFDITSSKRVFQSEWKTSGVPFYRAREIVQLSRNGYVDNELFITEELYSEYTEKYGKPQEGDIMVTGVGTLGICYLVKVNDTFYFKDGNIIWLKKKTDNISEYVEYAFKSNFVKNQVENSSGATVGTYTIIRANKTIIPIPQSIHTQKQIVEELDLLSSIIEKKKAQLNELDNLAQSFFYEMFGDPIMNEKGWKVKKLGEVGKFINGDRGKNYPSQKDFVDNGIPFINAGHIKENHVDMETMNYISREKFEKLGSGKIQDGDILFCLRGSLGKKAIVKNLTEGAIASSLVIIRVVDANINYISFYLESDAVKKEILKNNNGSSQPNLSAKSVASFHVPVPPLELQQRFAEKVESIERQKELIKKSIKEVEMLLSSRMDYYFN
jgi:type I restriction enzyme S subunit